MVVGNATNRLIGKPVFPALRCSLQIATGGRRAGKCCCAGVAAMSFRTVLFDEFEKGGSTHPATDAHRFNAVFDSPGLHVGQ